MPIIDNYRQQNVTDGVEATLEQIDNAQRFLGARLMDQILGQLIPGQGLASDYGGVDTQDFEFFGQRGKDPFAGPFAVAVTPGGAYLRQGSTNSKLQIAPGTLLQKIVNVRGVMASGPGGPSIGGPGADGMEETLLAFTFDGTQEVTIANGDVVNPRVDLLQMKLELVDGDDISITYDSATPPTVNLIAQSSHTTRRVQCTLAVKTGTPAASPRYPDPDAGFVAVAGIVVGANYVAAAGFKFIDTAGAVAVVHDQRLPIGIHTHNVSPRAYSFARTRARNTQLSAMIAQSTSLGPVQSNGTHWEFQATTGPLMYPIDIEMGSRITGYTAHVNKVSGAGTITARLYKYNSNTKAITALGVGVTYPSSSGYDEMTETGLAIDVSTTQEYYYLQLNGGGTTGDDANSVDIFSFEPTVPGTTASAGWTEDALGEVLTAVAASALLRVESPVNMSGRIIGVALGCKSIGAGAFVGRKTIDAAGAVTIENGITTQLGATPGAFHKFGQSLIDGNEYTHNPAAGPIVLPSATYQIGVPLWSGGARAPLEENRTGTGQPSSAVISLSANAGALVGSSTFFVAEGL